MGKRKAVRTNRTPSSSQAIERPGVPIPARAAVDWVASPASILLLAGLALPPVVPARRWLRGFRTRMSRFGQDAIWGVVMSCDCW